MSKTVPYLAPATSQTIFMRVSILALLAFVSIH